MKNKESDYPPRIKRILLILLFCFISLFILKSFERPKETNTDLLLKFEEKVINKYIEKLNNDGYENISYDKSFAIKFSEEHKIPLRMTMQPGETIDDVIIRKYDYFAIYYSLNINDKDYFFKTENEALEFLKKIKEYDKTEYGINKTKKIIKSETSQEELDEIINIKKKAYEEKKRQEEYERKRKEEENKKKNSQSTKQNLNDLQKYARDLVINTYGWSEYDFDCLVKLWYKESGWNPNAHNKSSGAHGIPQALPASKMASEGSDYYTNGYTQIRWGLKYIKGRYGTPSNAWGHFQRKNWY